MLKRQYANIYHHQDTLWWYQGMRAVNESLLKKFLPQNANLKILDAGCGPGAALLYLAKFGDVIGVDISDEALKYAKKRGKVKKADISSLPFKDSTFDVVVCLDLLYHKWVNTKKAVAEIVRVLKPGGIFLVREPAFDWFKSSEDIASQTKHRFTKEELRKELSSSFEILKLTYVNFFLFPLAFIKRIPEVLNLRKKKGVSDIQTVSPMLNKILFSIFAIEQFFLEFMSFPFGTSVICVARKNDKKN